MHVLLLLLLYAYTLILICYTIPYTNILIFIHYIFHKLYLNKNIDKYNDFSDIFIPKPFKLLAF